MSRGSSPYTTDPHGVQRVSASYTKYMMNSMFTVEPFRLEGAPSAQGPKWRLWIQRLELFFDTMEIVVERKRLFLLHLVGADVPRLVNALQPTSVEMYDNLKEALTYDFGPLANPD